MSNIIALASMDAQSAIEEIPDAALEERARAAMLAVQHHWLATQEEDQFMAACEALARTATPEERDRIIEELRRLKRAASVLNALMAGVPVDMEAVEIQVEEDDPDFVALDLRGIWSEVSA